MLTQVNVLENEAAWDAVRERILLVGPPNSGKTASLETFCLADERMAYIQWPGEQGSGSFPAKKLGDRALVFIDQSDNVGPIDYAKELAAVKQIVFDVITGKYGKIDVIALDGLHKGYELFLAKVTGGISAKTLEFDAKLYEDARKEFLGFLNIIFRAVAGGKLRRVVATCWDGREKDDPDDKSKTATTHLFPDLPGKLAKGIVGEFGVVLGSRVQGMGNGAKYSWLTRPYGKVGGVGIKAPKDVMASVPLDVPQDWSLLYPLIHKGA
ncbi:MAG: AAA family ATPase [Cetobacterium sp.]